MKKHKECMVVERQALEGILAEIRELKEAVAVCVLGRVEGAGWAV